MARHAIPQVVADRLIQPEKTASTFQPIQVGSQDWYKWLDEPATRSFAIESPTGSLTARREQRQDTWYWYAYRSLNGRTQKVYLGKSGDLTPERLREAATLFSAKGAMDQKPSDALVPARPAVDTAISPQSEIPSLHLLATKMSVPPTRPNTVARPRLTQRLNMAAKERLTLIVAPAGWEKQPWSASGTPAPTHLPGSHSIQATTIRSASGHTLSRPSTGYTRMWAMKPWRSYTPPRRHLSRWCLHHCSTPCHSFLCR